MRETMQVMGMDVSYQNSVESRTAGYMPVISSKKEDPAVSFHDALRETEGAGGAEIAAQEEESGFLSFLFGLLDVINPLQHIPVISTIYRHLTGDEISPVARIAGDALYGGPLGAAAGLADVAVESATGRDIGENVIAMVTGDEASGSDTMIASALNEVQPAARVILPEDIIWYDPAPSLARAPQNEHPFPAAGIHPAVSPGAPAPGRLSVAAVLTASASGEGGEPPPPRTEAVPDKEVQPELVPLLMMDALDKYAAMKKHGL